MLNKQKLWHRFLQIILDSILSYFPIYKKIHYIKSLSSVLFLHIIMKYDITFFYYKI